MKLSSPGAKDSKHSGTGKSGYSASRHSYTASGWPAVPTSFRYVAPPYSLSIQKGEDKEWPVDVNRDRS